MEEDHSCFSEVSSAALQEMLCYKWNVKNVLSLTSSYS
jgi:hypothetical protein